MFLVSGEWRRSKEMFAELIKGLHNDESGQDLLEYALVLAAVLVAVVAGSNSLATTINSAMATLSGKINNAVQ